MTTTTREFRWDDASAPVLDGTAGSFYALIKACLVGVSGVAYGSGPTERLAAGWTLEWDDPGAYKAVFRNSVAVGGTGCYLRVVDDGASAGGARVARVAMYESMTNIDTGTGLAGEGYIWKALIANSSPRAYTLHADERQWLCTVYVRSNTPPVSNTDASACEDCNVFGGGDYTPIIPGDSGCWAAVTTATNPSTSNNVVVYSGLVKVCSSAATVADAPNTAFWVSRDITLTLASTQVAVLLLNTPAAPYAVGGSAMLMADPSPGTLGQHMAPMLIAGGGAIRGRIRGMFIPLNRWNGGGAHVGTTHAPLNTTQSLSLAALAGCSSLRSATSVGRVFLERLLSWDDV